MGSKHSRESISEGNEKIRFERKGLEESEKKRGGSEWIKKIGEEWSKNSGGERER